MLTRKGKYGLKAMLHLAQQRDQKIPVLATEIASTHDIPKKFLDSILGELRTAGFVRTKKGRGGGYSLAVDPNDLAIGDIIRVLDGPLAPIGCASKTRYQPCDDCRSERSCRVRLIMWRVRTAISNVLDECSLAEFASSGRSQRDLLKEPVGSKRRTVRLPG